MEEAELMKERLLAITDKRKLQEDIAQKRLKVEEEKLKLHHLKKKALREKWLLDGLSALTPEEQEEMVKQNQLDQEQIKHLDINVTRLEKEIDELEKAEMQLSAKEIRVLQRLKSVERTNEDIIKAVKAEAIEVEAVKTDIYAGIPDLPASYKPTFIRRMESTQNENGEEQRKALFAMEIKVAKDKKTGESTVLSSIPVSSAELKDAGVKVYDDGRKSVYAMDREGNVTQNGVDTLAPVEVEDLLRKATEKSSKSPTEYHEPVYSTQYNNVSSYGQISPRTNGHHSPLQEINGNVHGQTVFSKSIMNGTKTGETQSYPDISRQISQTRESVEEPKNSPSTSSGLKQSQQAIEEKKELYSKPTDNSHQAMSTDSGYTTEHPSSAYEEDTRYSIVHATPCIVDDSEPVTMIFMGYQHADESDAKPISDYEGIIRAELVIIDDDNEEEIKLDEENVTKGISISPIPQRKQILQNDTQNITVQKLPNQNIIMRNQIPYKNSISLQEQEASLSHSNYSQYTRQTIDDGTEDPSLTALRIRMAKLGKKVI